MTTKLNQKVMLSVPETGVKSKVENRVETDQEFSATAQSTTAIAMYEDAKNTEFKALGHLIMTMLTLTMMDFSQSNRNYVSGTSDRM